MIDPDADVAATPGETTPHPRECATILRMEPDADPEARIRDLERPLAERARASELGTQPYTTPTEVPVPAPSPYPPPLGPSPYYAPPQRVVHKNSHATALWLVPIVVGVVVVTAAIGAIVYFTSGSPDLPAPRPGISGGGGSIDVPTDVPIEIPTDIPSAPGIDSGEQVVTVGPGAATSLGGVDTRRTVQCDGGTVNISGVDNVVEVQGGCAAVLVSGVGNVVTVDTAATITASGMNNQVTYRSGTPEVSRSGTGNVVEQGPVGATP